MYNVYIRHVTVGGSIHHVDNAGDCKTEPFDKTTGCVMELCKLSCGKLLTAQEGLVLTLIGQQVFLAELVG